MSQKWIIITEYFKIRTQTTKKKEIDEVIFYQKKRSMRRKAIGWQQRSFGRDRYIDIENNETFDVFVMIWCALDLLRLVAEIRAEKGQFNHSSLVFPRPLFTHETKMKFFFNLLTRRFNASSRRIGRKVYKSFRISISKTDVSSGYEYQ